MVLKKSVNFQQLTWNQNNKHAIEINVYGYEILIECLPDVFDKIMNYRVTHSSIIQVPQLTFYYL